MHRTGRYVIGSLLLLETAALLFELRQVRQWRIASQLAQQTVVAEREAKRTADETERLAQTEPRTEIRIGGVGMGPLDGTELTIFKQRALEIRSPEYAGLRRIEEMTELRFRYASFFKNQRLNADQVAKLLGLLSDQQNLPQDMNRVAADQKVGMNDFRKAFAAAQNELGNGIKDLLGAEGNSQLAAYQAHLGTYLCVSQLQQELGANADHLSDAQVEMLTSALLKNPPAPLTAPWDNSMIPLLTPTWYGGDAYSSGLPPGGQPNIVNGNYRFVMRSVRDGYVDPEGNIDSAYLATEEAMAAAAGLLTPAQLSTLEEVRQKETGERGMAEHFDSGWSRRKVAAP